MSRITSGGWTGLGCALAALAVDQVAKTAVLNTLVEGVQHPIVWPMAFTRTWNDGMSFGLLQDSGAIGRWGFVLFSLTVAGFIAYWANKSERIAAAGFGLIAGGALGNAVDRAVHGRVVDFLDASALGFFPWIFNTADSFIFIGVAILLLDSLRPQRPAGSVGPSA